MGWCERATSVRELKSHHDIAAAERQEAERLIVRRDFEHARRTTVGFVQDLDRGRVPAAARRLKGGKAASGDRVSNKALKSKQPDAAAALYALLRLL